MESQHHGALVLRAEPVAHDVRPEPARGTELGHFLEEIEVAVEEECNARREVVDGQTTFDAGLDVRNSIGKGERDLLCGRAARFAHVITADADRVPAGHFLRAELDDVGDQSQRRRRREDVRAPCDVLLEDVVLHRAGYFRPRHALFFRDGEVQSQ